MKYIGFFLLLPFLTHSQNKLASSVGRGASPIEIKTDQSTSGTTYAVVVGISDYQDKDIPDLRFADKDAEAFANFLRSPAGGSLDGDHLKILTNNQATLGQLASGFDWLLEVAKEGDNIIIYFSGHGDVETKRLSQPGYLLGWDAPARNYMAGGAVNVRDFQDIVSTLSVTNKARVVVITDACHAGKLSGSEINGAQLTGQNLARQFANEVKILSCQPNEYSIEGEQWGGGRGAFSFNLVNALYGLADGNNDLSVTLQEVGRYLEDHVTSEVAPVSQVPIMLGNRSDRLATVDAKLLSALRSGKTSQMAMLSPVETRGMEDDVLAGLDTTTRKLYGLFKKSLKDKVFLLAPSGEPAAACADAYYERLIQEPKLARLHSTMTRNYAAALQDDAQQTLNAWLRTKQEVSLQAAATERLTQKLFTEKVMTFPRCLDRAAELLGSKHYMYAALKARQYFFEGYLLANSTKNPNSELGGRALALFRQSLSWQPEQPQVYWQMSLVFGYSFRQPDSLEHYTRLAMELHPNWITPCLDAVWVLSFIHEQQKRARPFLELASRIDSSSTDVMLGWAIFNIGEKNYSEAEQNYRKVIKQDSTMAGVWNDLGYIYLLTHRYNEMESVLKKAIALDSTIGAIWNTLGNLYSRTLRLTEAEAAYKKAIALDSTYIWAWSNLGTVYFNTRRYAEAEPFLKKVIALDSTYAEAHRMLGNVYLKTNRPEEARRQFLKTIELDPNARFARLGLAAISYTEGKTIEAIGYVEQAIGKGSTMEQLEKDEDLAPLRSTPEWKTLMKKHFPNQFKD